MDRIRLLRDLWGNTGNSAAANTLLFNAIPELLDVAEAAHELYELHCNPDRATRESGKVERWNRLSEVLAKLDER